MIIINKNQRIARGGLCLNLFRLIIDYRRAQPTSLIWAYGRWLATASNVVLPLICTSLPLLARSIGTFEIDITVFWANSKNFATSRLFPSFHTMKTNVPKRKERPMHNRI
jgi:hypothetical protein